MSKIRTLSGQKHIPKPKMKRITIDPNEIKILMLCDYNCTTGFGYVASQFINEVKKDGNYKIVIHAINDFSKEPYQEGENVVVMPSYLNKKGDIYGRIQFLNALYQTDFDLVFILNDVEIISQLMEHILNIKREKKKEKRKGFKLITYSPIDSPVREADLKGFEYIDAPITYTQYAKDVIENVKPKMIGKTIILPHGLNSDVFHKIHAKTIRRRKIKMFGKQNENAFVFGTINRNQVRKDIGGVLISFAKFKKANPDENAILYLHCNPNDPKGINLSRASKRLGLDFGKDIFFPNPFNENKGVTLSELNEIYNVFDVFVNSTTAEGWGLTIMEAMATETPVITPIHTSLFEVTNKGELVEPLNVAHEMIFVDDGDKIRFVSDPQELCDKMQKLFDILLSPNTKQWLELQEKKANAVKFVRGFKWDAISKEFKKILDNQHNKTKL